MQLQIFERPQGSIYNIDIYINKSEMETGVMDLHVLASGW